MQSGNELQHIVQYKRKSNQEIQYKYKIQYNGSDKDYVDEIKKEKPA